MKTPASILGRSFFIGGPTASGKTEVAVAVAEASGGEIVSADAFQLYRGLDLLTAKPSPAFLARASHHLVGTVDLADSFNVARYLDSALVAIAAILDEGRLPIIVGGTGLYLRALTRGLSAAPSSNPELRAELNQTSLSDLVARLERLDPAAAVAVDRSNPRRVIRALEIVLLTGKPFASFRREWGETPAFHGVLLDRPRKELYERINRRTVAMFERGVVEEVRAVLADYGQGVSSSDREGATTFRQVIGLRPIEALLRGELTQAQCIDAICQATRQYAKRQLTWFRREPMFSPVSLTAANEIQPIREIVNRAVAVVRST